MKAKNKCLNKSVTRSKRKYYSRQDGKMCLRNSVDEVMRVKEHRQKDRSYSGYAVKHLNCLIN